MSKSAIPQRAVHGRWVRRRSFGVGTLSVVAALVLAACGGSSEEGGTATTSPDSGGSGEPVELTFWSWMTNIKDVVAIWNNANPDIHVTVDRLAEGDDLVTRIITANKAGNLPDLMQAEYQALPVLVSNGIVADLSQDVKPIRDSISEGAWNQVTWNGKTFAVPGDIAPLMMFYREDRFAELGLTVPTTWKEFAETARSVRAADPSSYLTSFSPGDTGWFAGLSQQAGADWWSTEGESWKVNIDSEPTQRVATFWGDLVAEHAVATNATYSAEWNAALNDGTQLAWVSPVWGAGVIAGIAPDTAGLWRAAPMPQWSTGQDVTGYWGGSSAAISAHTKHYKESMKFLTWLFTSTEATKALVDISGLYPAAVSGQEYALQTVTPAILKGQDDFYRLAAHAASVARGFTWSPNVTATYSTLHDAFSAAIEAGTPLVDALPAIESSSQADLEAQGYQVAK